MSETRLTEIEACVFDAYGTLFDLTSPIIRRRERIGEMADKLCELWRRKQLEYSWLRTLMGRHADFWHVTGDALDYAMKAVGIDDPGLRAELMQVYLSLGAYPEARGAVERIKGSGMRTAILSNGSPTMLMALVNRAEMNRMLDAVLSVEEKGLYKPHPSVYQLAVETLGVAAPHVCFVSGNGWDVAGAAAFGFQVVWVNRGDALPEILPHGPMAEIGALDELPPLLGL